MQVNGEDGPCQFNIGQLFHTQRVYSTVAYGDVFETDDTTRGFLSAGCTGGGLTLNGSPKDDVFNVLRNKCVLDMHGEAGKFLRISRCLTTVLRLCDCWGNLRYIMLAYE